MISILLERGIVANQFRRPEYQPTKRVDEPDGGPLGHVLFSPSRVDGVDTTEPNTDLESNIFNSIVSHVEGNDDYQLSQLVEPILGLVNNGKYDLLKPINGHVYRVMKFNILNSDSSHLNNLGNELHPFHLRLFRYGDHHDKSDVGCS